MVVPRFLLELIVNRAFEPIHHGADHVHADAAAGNFGDFGGGAEAGLENQIEGFVIGKALRVFVP